jgi:hypothetical protein
MLILSEFAGAAQSLSGAIRINPWNIDELSDAMHQALSTDKAVRELQQKKLYRYVSTHTSSVWAKSFMDEISVSSMKRIEQVTLRLERQQRERETKVEDDTEGRGIEGSTAQFDDANAFENSQMSGIGGGKVSDGGVGGGGYGGGGGGGSGEGGGGGGSGTGSGKFHEIDNDRKKEDGGQISTSVTGVTLNKSVKDKKGGISNSIVVGGTGNDTNISNRHRITRGSRRTRRLPIVRMLQAYNSAGSATKHNRVLVLDYDGLLATRDVVPELSKPSPFVTSYLVQLASNPSNLLVVLSGRSRTVLETWLTAPDGSPIDCAIGAENGVFFRQNPSSTWENMGLVQDAETWKSQVLPIMQFFSERTPGTTFVE